MPKAVQFEEYGGVEVLQVVEVPRPVAEAGEVLVRVKAAGINPGEAKIRQGLLHSLWPAKFPSGEGSDLAGVVEETGSGVSGFAAGDEVIGFTHQRASHAEYVRVETDHLVTKPPGVSWEAAGGLFVAGTTAFAAVRAVGVREGDTVVVSGAAGGVGSIAVQLARLAGGRVVGIAGEANHQWLTDHGVTPILYGDGTAERLIDAADRIDAFIDTYGDDYVPLALKLGVDPARIDTIIPSDAVERYGVRADGNSAGASREVLTELARLIAEQQLEIPIAGTYPLSAVQQAYRQLETGHIRGKIVLLP